MKYIITSASAALFTFSVQIALADGIQDCDKALVLATYNRTDKQFIDWRLAEIVDRQTYNTIHQEAGASAIIYGVPVGGDYDSFKQNIATLKRSNQQSFKEDTFRNIAWTGLDVNSVNAYSKCIDAVRQNAKGLALIPLTATQTDVSFELVYRPVGRSPNPLQIQWEGVRARKPGLPRQTLAGSRTIIVARPNKESTLGVNGNGLTDKIVLKNLPPPLSPRERLLTSCKITATPSPLPQLGAGASTTWACLPMLGGSYRAAFKVKPSASGCFRTSSSIFLTSGSGNKKTSVLLPESSDVVDVNIPNSGKPDTFMSIGQPVTLSDGPALFSLNVNRVVECNNFPNSQGNDGVLSIPEGVEIRLDPL